MARALKEKQYFIFYVIYMNILSYLNTYDYIWFLKILIGA
jgi:hypothetical protein